MLNNRIALAFCLCAGIVICATGADAQGIVIGGAGGLGVFNGIWTWFKSNMALGLAVLGIAALAIALIAGHFHAGHVAKICAGVAILANAVALGSLLYQGAGTLGGGIGG